MAHVENDLAKKINKTLFQSYNEIYENAKKRL